MKKTIMNAGRVVTCDPAREMADNSLGVIADGAVAIDGSMIVDVGSREAIAKRHRGAVMVQGSLLTPGLIDAHTHAPWVGSRDGEYVLRMAGADYEAIARAGGGIVSSMRAIRAATRAEIAETLAARLSRMATLGVTTVEAKSGYGLDEASERKQLEAVADARSRSDLPRVVPTYLALHALPPDRANDRAGYAREVADVWLPAIAKAGLAEYVDAYVDRAAFSTAEARPVLARARKLGLGVRIHIGQFADVGGAELAAEFGAASVDHLEHVSEAGMDRLRDTGVHAVLLPVASFTLRQEPPPIAALRSRGIPLVVASDANPGTAPTESLPLALAFAVRMYGLTVSETLLGATRHAAKALGLAGQVGMLRAGMRADVAMWDFTHENAIVQPWGATRTRMVVRDGVVIAGA